MFHKEEKWILSFVPKRTADYNSTNLLNLGVKLRNYCLRNKYGNKENRIHPQNFDLTCSYLCNVNNENIKTFSEIWSKLTKKTSESRQSVCSGDFFVNFEQISHIVMAFSRLTLTSRWQQLTIFAKTLHLRCLTGLWIRHCIFFKYYVLWSILNLLVFYL